MIKYKNTRKNKQNTRTHTQNTRTHTQNTRTRTRTKFKNILPTLKGGKYIDEGTYGCVISPALPCSQKDKNLDKSVSKIIRDSRKDINSELQISTILRNLDPTKKYYITYDKYCYIKNIPENRNDIVSVHYTDSQLSKYEINNGQKNKDTKACDIEL